jgi:hypothetical protein
MPPKKKSPTARGQRPTTPKGPTKIPPRNHRISVKAAADLTARFRKYAGPPTEKGGVFHADQVIAMLRQPGVKGLRYYHGRQPDGRYALVLVGTDAFGEDIVKIQSKATRTKSAAKLAATSEAIVLEMNFPCPPFCAGGSPLDE